MKPLKVALLGAPGSGKTKIARRITRRLNSEAKSWAVVDGYVDKLAERTGRTYGEVFNPYAFPLNLQVMAERWTLEDEATAKSLNTITCGTIYETFIYAAAVATQIQFADNEQWMMELNYIAQTMMNALSVAGAIRFDYDVMLYLPLTVENKDWAGVVDAKISEVLEGQNLVALVLDGTDKQKVDRATLTIKTAYEAAVTLDERRAIRSPDATGEGQEHRPDEVSDVREAAS